MSESIYELCPDCDHGLRGGKPCQSCDGSGLTTEALVKENAELRARIAELESIPTDADIDFVSCSICEIAISTRPIEDAATAIEKELLSLTNGMRARIVELERDLASAKVNADCAWKTMQAANKVRMEAEARVKELEAAHRWIPVEEALPEVQTAIKAALTKYFNDGEYGYFYLYDDGKTATIDLTCDLDALSAAIQTTVIKIKGERTIKE